MCIPLWDKTTLILLALLGDGGARTEGFLGVLAGVSPLPCPQVTITVLDENDNSPQFDITSDSAVSVPEDSVVGRRVAVVLARDPDAGSNGQVGQCIFPKHHTSPFPCPVSPSCQALHDGCG